MQKNSNRCKNVKNNKICTVYNFQSYNTINLGKVIPYKAPISCSVQNNCSINQYKFNQYVANQQDTYALMRRMPEKFPLIPSSQYLCYTPQQQRFVSNRWYRQFGTSQSLPANDNWGGFYVAGSEVPYTN